MLCALVVTLGCLALDDADPPARVGRTREPQGYLAAPRTYTAVRTVDTIVVDGKASEETWKQAPVDDRFVERQPNLGARPPVRTTVQVAYDDQALYVFVEAFSKPGDVFVRTLRRDNEGIFADDAVYVKIDAQRSRREAVSFGVNAEGVQVDEMGLEDGRDLVLAWDAVWEAETVRRNDGYTAEYRIPFAVLGVKNASQHVFGFNVTRDQPSRNATYDWRVIVPPRSPISASQFGDLVGLRNIRGRRALEYIPYALLRTDFRPRFSLDPRSRPNFAVGADLRVQVGTGSYVEVSALTDFAQVEVDEVQVARDRFPLFFPERRPFFINGLEVFNFGLPGAAQLFFSRRVGLVDGRPVPIAAGVKSYGRAGPVSYGVLEVQTLGMPSSTGGARIFPENVAVGRVRVQATDSLAVGMMMLGRHRFGVADRDHAAGGIDARLVALRGRLQGYGFVAGTFAQRPAVTDTPSPTRPPEVLAPPHEDIGASALASLEYQGLYVRPGVGWLWSDRHFSPELGFYRRPATSKQEARVMFVPRPKFLGLREIEFGPHVSIETDSDYEQVLTQTLTESLRLNWKNGTSFGYNVAFFSDEVQDPFELYRHVIEAQRYRGFRHLFTVASPYARAVYVDSSYELIELFGGLTHQPSLGFAARLGKHFTFRGRYTHVVGHFQDQDERFNFGFANANVDIAITRNLAFDTLTRLDLSPQSERFGLQSRLRWRFLPGSDLYFVYLTDVPIGSRWGDVRPYHELTLKFTYYLRALI